MLFLQFDKTPYLGVHQTGSRPDIYSQPLSRAMAAHGILSPEQQAAFLAQVSVESANLRHTAENLNYSAERIVEVWPSRFPNIDSAKPYANNPEALANRVYGNRMGNSGIEGAGYRFRGRGLIQVTGRDGYRAIGYVNNPEALELPEIAAASAAKYWRANNLHLRTTRELTRREFDSISRYVNGGNHGINERWLAYQRALLVLRQSQSAR
jgi:putative chitinase